MFLWLQQNVRWIAILGGLLLLSILPFEMSSPFHNSQRLISSVFIVLALGIWVWSAVLTRKALWLISGIYVYGILVTVLSSIPVWSLVEFSLLFSFMLFVVVFSPKVNQKTINLLAVFFVVVQAFYLTRNLTNYFFVMVTEASFDAFALIDGFSNVRFYGQFLLWTVPFVLGVMASQDKFPYRNVILLVISLNWALEFFTGTRAFVLGMLVSIIAVFWVAKVYWKQYLQYWFLTAIIGLGIYYLMAFAIPGWSQQTEKVEAVVQQSAGRELTATGDRFELWMDTLHLGLDHPWLGAGPMTTAVQGVSRIAAHPHNYLLQLMAEWGGLFTLLLIGLSAYGIWCWRAAVREQAPERETLALPVAATVGAVLASGLVDGFMVMPVSLVYMSLVLAVAVSLWRQWSPTLIRKPIPRWYIPVLLLPALFLLTFSVLGWSGVAGDDLALSGFQTLDMGFPRFWTRGNIVAEGFD